MKSACEIHVDFMVTWLKLTLILLVCAFGSFLLAIACGWIPGPTVAP